MNGNSDATKEGEAIPASFRADPLVHSLYNGEDDFFNLFLMLPWPPLDSVSVDSKDVDAYEEFSRVVKTCFDDEDVAGDRPSVFLCEKRCLHVTVATFHTHKRKSETPGHEQMALDYTNLVRLASQRSDWPTEPIQLKIKSLKLSVAAGIILWEEQTGGLEKMRSVIAAEAEKLGLKIHQIPNIVHSSFLRFANVPKTPIEEVYRRFDANVIPAGMKLFQQPMEMKEVKLITETTPHDIVVDDEDHVLTQISLEKEQK